MDFNQYNRIIESIYQASIDSEQWDNTLKIMSDYFHSTAAGLFIQNGITGQLPVAYFLGVKDDWLDSYARYYSKINPTFCDTGVLQPGEMFTEQIFNRLHRDKNFYTNSQFYKEWMEPQAFHHTSGGLLFADNENLVNLTFMRPDTRGGYSAPELEQQTMIARHMCRAIHMSEIFDKLNYRLHNLENLLKGMGYGVVMLDNAQNILEVNTIASNYFARHQGIGVRQGKLVAFNEHDQHQLSHSLKQAVAFTQAQKEIPVRIQLSGANEVFLILMPVTFSHQSQFKELAVILIIKDARRSTPLSVEYLQEAYLLSASEARLTKYLADGFELKKAALKTGVSYETARWYLKSIFEKTNTNRQVDLILLMNADPVSRMQI